MTPKNIILLIHFALCSVLVAEIPSQARVAEILKFCSLLDEGGFGYRREGNLSINDKKNFQEWFKMTDDPLASINQLVSDDTLRARAVIVASAVLDDDHFYRVSLNALQRFADGEASEKELERILMPDPDKIGLLDVHFDDKVLQTKLKNCLHRGISDPAYVNIVNRILSGEGAKSVLRNIGGGISERYGPLAEQAINNRLNVHGGKKSRPVMQEVMKVTNAIGNHWLWMAGAVILMLAAWFLLKHRS